MNAGATGKLLEVFQTIDARGWEPPQPMVRVLDALEHLPRGQKVVMFLHCEPRPLFKILTHNSFHYRCRFVPDGHFEVTIWHAVDTPVSSAGLD
jgi:uncharacterized protein (DUF2249 family)